MGCSVPWHCHECGECGRPGDAGGRDACVVARVFAAQAGATGRYCQDPVRAATWRGHQSVSTREYIRKTPCLLFVLFIYLLFIYFFAKKVENIIPAATLQITSQVSRLCFKSRSSRKVHEKYTCLEKYAYISKCVHISREVVPPWDN